MGSSRKARKRTQRESDHKKQQEILDTERQRQENDKILMQNIILFLSVVCIYRPTRSECTTSCRNDYDNSRSPRSDDINPEFAHHVEMIHGLLDVLEQKNNSICLDQQIRFSANCIPDLISCINPESNGSCTTAEFAAMWFKSKIFDHVCDHREHMNMNSYDMKVWCAFYDYLKAELSCTSPKSCQ